MSRISQLTHLEHCSSTLLSRIPLQLANGFIFFLIFCELSSTIGLLVLAYPFLGLFLGLSLDFTRIQNELIFHDNCHIPNPKLWFISLNQSKFNFIILLLQFLLFFLPLQLFSLIFSEKHRHHNSIALIRCSDPLVLTLTPNLRAVYTL